MNYKIVIDSCGELTEEMKQDVHFESVPLSIDIDDEIIVDDETFNQGEFLKKVAASPNCPKSSCPSPERYMSAYDCEAERIYAVTLSAELSGSNNSAELGKTLFLEEHPTKKVHVFNSRSASVAQTLIAIKIKECEDNNLSFEETVGIVEAYIEEQKTFFVLESLEALRKNGRLSNLKAFVATALKIKPVMGATPEGAIFQLAQARGMNKALVKLVDYVVEVVGAGEDRMLAISHCNCIKRAKMVKEVILERTNLKNILILDTAGISSLYASDGGIIIVV
jgi:EDD domain protein, DegV family